MSHRIMSPLVPAIISKLLRDERGSTLILFALIVNVLLLSIALSMDMGRAYLTRTTMSGTSDAAALAGARKGDLSDPNTEATIYPEAELYFKANMPEDRKTFGVAYDYDSEVKVRLDRSKGRVIVNPVDFDVPVYFGFAAGQDQIINVAAISAVQVPTKPRPVNYYLMFDVSGSMDNVDSTTTDEAGNELPGKVQRLVAAKDQARRMVNFIFPKDRALDVDKNGVPYYQMAFIPYETKLITASTTQLTSDRNTLLNAIDSIPKVLNLTCGDCGFQKANELLAQAKIAKPNSVNIYIFMTDGNVNTIYTPAPLTGNGTKDPSLMLRRGWPYKVNNDPINPCPYQDVKGNTTPFYNQSYNGKDMRKTADKSKYPPEAIYPKGFNPTDKCAPGQAAMAQRCATADDGGAIIHTIQFGKDPSVNSKFDWGEFSKPLTVELMQEFCPHEPVSKVGFKYYHPAENGAALGEIFRDIVQNTQTLRIVQ